MHFYEQTEKGVKPRHYVEMTSDPSRLRPTRMSDVKKAAKDDRIWVPSVTTILNVLAKPALMNWKIDQYLEQALLCVKAKTDPDLFNLDVDSFKKEVKRIAEMEMDKAPSAGTDFHKLMERFVIGDLFQLDDKSNWYLCNDTWEKVSEKTGVSFDSVTPELRFVSGGYGGQVDLSNNDWVIDYKTKQTADKFKPGKMAYQDHYTQLAAYRQAIAPRARCANVFVCLEDGQVDFHEHKEEDLQKGWGIFSHALEIWKLQH